jgi:hypothetical protein
LSHPAGPWRARANGQAIVRAHGSSLSQKWITTHPLDELADVAERYKRGFTDLLVFRLPDA